MKELKDTILKVMNSDANYNNGSLQTGVFSAFQLSCIINKENVNDYKIRKALNHLMEIGMVDKKKFLIEGESNLKCWGWVMTEKGSIRSIH